MILQNVNTGIARMENIKEIHVQLSQQNRYKASGNIGSKWWNENVHPEYVLSENQVVKINLTWADSMERISTLQNKLVDLRKEFMGHGRDSRNFIRRLRSYKMNIHKLEDEIIGINLRAEIQIRQMLNSKQLKYFIRGGYKWWNSVDSCWYRGADNMPVNKERMKMSDRGFSW